MAEAFLSQLLRAENCVQGQPNHRRSGECCIICHTEFNTLCDQTGAVEWEVRLPCNHTVGSRCIAIWLDPTSSAKNSCPMCRHIFFPAQPRPYLEHGVIGDDEGIPLDTPEDLRARGYVINDTWQELEYTENDTQEEENTPDLQTIRTMCETFCYRLSLTANPRAIELSQRIAHHILEGTDVAIRSGDFSDSAIAAVSVFIVSHFIGMPKTLAWVAMNSDATISAIAGLYWYVHHGHDLGEALDEEMLTMIGRGDREAVIGFLPEAN